MEQEPLLGLIQVACRKLLMLKCLKPARFKRLCGFILVKYIHVFFSSFLNFSLFLICMLLQQLQTKDQALFYIGASLFINNLHDLA